MANLLTKFKRRIHRVCYIDLNNDYKNTIFLSGTGRSGTTWISDIINYKNEYRYIFEPFHPEKVSISKKFGRRRYIRENSQDPELLQSAKTIVSGKIRNFWADNLNTRIISNKRLVKCIRANLFLKWLHINFPGMPIILLLRHPCATAYSHLKFNLKVSLEDYLSQKDLINDFLHPFAQEIERAKDGSDFEKHIFVWCIENYIPLMQFKKDEICIVFYENFCKNPEIEIKKMFTFLNKEYEEDVFNTLSKPSSLSRNWSAINSGESLISGWKKNVSEKQVDKAYEILNIFKMEKIYKKDSLMPDENAVCEAGPSADGWI